MKKLSISKSARHQFDLLGIDCINNAGGAVYLRGSMRNVATAVSKILVLNPGVKVQCMNTAVVKISKDEESAVVNAVVIFELETEDE